MPSLFPRYLMAVAAAGALAAALTTRIEPRPSIDPTLLVFVLAAVVAVVVPIRLQRAGGTQAFTVEGGLAVAMLLAGYASVAPAVLMGASLLGHGARTRSPTKTLFNAGRSGLETAAAAAVFLVLAPPAPAPTDARSVAAAVVAALAFELVSIVVMTELFHRLADARRDQVMRDVSRLSVITFVGNTSYGIILASLALVHVWIAGLAASFMLVMYLGYRGYAAALEGKQRADAINEVTHILLDLVGSDGGGERILSELVTIFGGERGDLIIETRQGWYRWTSREGQMTKSRPSELPRSGLLAATMARGHATVEADPEADSTDDRSSIAAPILSHGRPIGALSVSGRRGLEPWSASDVSLLSAIANELAVALDNVSLFHQVEEERARLEAESTKLNDILGAASDGIASILADGTIEAWNPGMAQITGVAIDAAVGQPWHAVLRLRTTDGRDLAPTGNHVVRRAVAGEFAGGSLSLQALRADGTWRWLQCTSSPVRDPDGRHRGVVVVARDVTSERELEDLKSDFIATVSHELRTPLTPLKGFLATLRNPRTTLTEDQLGSIHSSMSAQLTRLETLISDLLAVAELDHGQFDLHPEPMPLGELVAEAVEVEAAHEFSRCTLVVEPDVAAIADSVALVRIVRSLVSNAVKHTDGRVEVSIRSVGDEVHVTVADEGPGIASWDHQKVFNRFERLGNHLRRTQGPGLGLTIARTLAQRMDGDVTVLSDIGAGATFTLHLPRAKPRAVRLRAVSEV